MAAKMRPPLWNPGKYKFGSSCNIGTFQDPVTHVKSNGNYLLYFMANQAVFRQKVGSNRGLDLDFAVDWSPDINCRRESPRSEGIPVRAMPEGRLQAVEHAQIHGDATRGLHARS